MSIRSGVSLLQTWLHKPYNTGLQSLNQFFLLSSHVRHFKLKIQKTPSRQTSSFLSKEHKQTNKQTKSSYQREQKHTSQAHNSQPEKKEAQQVGSDVSQGPKLYQSTWGKLQTLYMHMCNWTRDPKTIYQLAAWIISCRIINKQTLSSAWALLELSFLLLFLGFEPIDFPSEMVTCKFSLDFCHFLVLVARLKAMDPIYGCHPTGLLYFIGPSTLIYSGP